MNGLGFALRRVGAVGATAAVLGVLGVGTAGPTLAQGGPLRARGGPIAVASVVDGSAASITEVPFQVALYDPRAGSPAKGFFCGGVILDATHVATAAHCLISERGQHSPPSEIEVLAGSTYLEPTDPGSVRDSVVAAIVDPAYNPAASDYDVGVLRLERPLWSGPTPALDGHSTIAPLAPDAAMAETRTAEDMPAAGYSSQTAASPTQAVVSGWGDLAPQPGGSPSYPLRLRKVHVPLVSTTLCEEEYATIEQPISPRMMCAGSAPNEAQGHPDSCYGDSGGPIVAPSSAEGSSPAGDVLLGLVDFGNGCGQAGYPGVYLRVADPAVARFLGGPPVASAGRRPRSLCQTGGRGRAGSGRAGARGQRVRRGGHRRGDHRRRRCA
jgi:secreted trypsin-like serine protease